jgi:hypothetical protein
MLNKQSQKNDKGWSSSWGEEGLHVHKLFIDFKKAYYSVRKEVLYNILIVWGTHQISQVD